MRLCPLLTAKSGGTQGFRLKNRRNRRIFQGFLTMYFGIRASRNVQGLVVVEIKSAFAIVSLY